MYHFQLAELFHTLKIHEKHFSHHYKNPLTLPLQQYGADRVLKYDQLVTKHKLNIHQLKRNKNSHCANICRFSYTVCPRSGNACLMPATLTRPAPACLTSPTIINRKTKHSQNIQIPTVVVKRELPKQYAVVPLTSAGVKSKEIPLNVKNLLISASPFKMHGSLL